VRPPPSPRSENKIQGEHSLGKNVIRDGIDGKPTQIALPDIVHQRCLQEIEIQPYGLNAIFSILPAFEPR